MSTFMRLKKGLKFGKKCDLVIIRRKAKVWWTGFHTIYLVELGTQKMRTYFQKFA